MVTTAENPLRSGMRLLRTPEPCAMIIMGATGDLTHRKLMPALYNLAVEHLLPHGFAVVGFSRKDKANEEFRADMKEAVSKYSRYGPVQPEVWDSFAERLFFQQADFGDSYCYECLDNLLKDVDEKCGTSGNRVFYLATPPTVISLITQKLGESGLVT